MGTPQLPTLPPRLRVNISSTFTAEPLHASLQWWLEHLGWTPEIQFAPYNQVFQQLLDPSSSFHQQREGVNVVLLRLEDWRRRGTPSGTGDEDRDSSNNTWVLPNGLEVAHLNRYETEYVYQEIFQDRVYLKHGITIDDGDCVVDIGANIGLFSLFVATQAPSARIFACEPSPAAFAALRHNLAQHAQFATPLNCGVGDGDRRMTFTAYARSSVFSSFYADEEHDRDAIRAVVRNVLREQGGVETDALESLTDTLVADRMESQQVEVELRTLSSVIEEHGLERIDLLKIDAEKSELAILKGIAAEDWRRIRQIVMEVHDTTGTVLPEVRAMLERNGFRLTAVEEPGLLHGSGLFNLYAQRTDLPQRQAQTPRHAGELLRTVSEFEDALRGSVDRTAIPHVVLICPPSAFALADPEWAAAAREVEQRLAESFGDSSDINIVTSRELLAVYPDASEHDARGERLGQIPYTPLAFVALGARVARAIYASTRPAAKVIVVDCDNTLWEGVCGEDGPMNVRIGATHRRLQRFLVEQQQLGRLVCLCSKNDEADVLEVFRSRRDFDLTLDHITSWRVNWQSKSANLRALAAELELGLDSFVFIDDNPAECAEVRAGCPEVVTVRMPSEEAGVQELLSHLWPCDRRRRVTTEDQQRTAMYRQSAERVRWRERAVTFDAFIAGLNLEVVIERLSAASMARAAQLTERTNQFNFTTIRRSEAQLQSLVVDGSHEFHTVRVKDRFGDYGLVGLIGFRMEDTRLVIDTFLISCRVLGKGVEHQTLAHVGKIAQARGLKRVELPYVPTRRNLPALQFAQSLDAATSRPVGATNVFGLETDAAATVRFDPSHASEVVASDAAASAASELPTTPLFLSRVAEEFASPARVLSQLVDRNASAGPVAAPRTPCEQRLVHIWRECLGRTPGIDENYFDLGGDSIRAVQIASRAQAENLPLTPKDVLECQTIAALAARLDRVPEASRVAATADQISIEPDAGARQQLLAKHPSLEDAYALTPMQAMFHAQYSAGLDVGFEQWQWRIEGAVSLPRYRRAWEQVLARHAALRTAFEVPSGSQPWQVVLSSAVLPWHEESLEQVPREAQAQRIRAYLDADRSRRLDLSQAPLMRVAVFALGGDRWHVVWTFHHLVVDGWSCPIVLSDVAAAYSSGGPEAKSARGALSFKRLVEWQARDTSRAEAYWRDAIADLSQPTPLPEHDGDQLFRGSTEGQLEYTWPESVNDGLVAQARADRVTIGTLLQGAWALVLAHATGHDEVTFGLTMSGRPPEIDGVEGIVGTFVNNVPVRVKVPRTLTVRELVQALQRQLNEAAEHQFLALVRVQSLSAVPARERLFNSLLVVQNYLGAQRGLSAWSLGSDASIVDLIAPIKTGYPVTLVVTPSNRLAVALIARSQAWCAGVGQEVLAALITVVNALAEPGTHTIGELLSRLTPITSARKQDSAGVFGAAHSQPRTSMERDIFDVWSAAFGHSHFGIDANFFDLGGHSLLMLKVHDALQERLKRQISIVELFEHPTVEGLGRRLTGHQESNLGAVKNRAQLQLEAMARQRRRGGAA